MMFRPLHKLMAISIAAQSAIVLAGPPDFGRDIRPILANSCFECHGPDESSREADLRLDTADGAQASGVIVPRRPEESELIKRLISNNPDEVMPPPNSPRRPTPQQVEQLRQWIADGARYDEHWAYALLQRPTLPEVSDSAWCQTPLDHFVLAKLDSADLVPQVEAEPEVLVRRLSLALNGLPPTVEEVDEFVKHYRLDRNLAISNWVDELLGREQFGEHFAWGWMDAARCADTNGYAHSVLLARRLIERGVRFVQVFQGGWDNHSNLPKQHPDYCAHTDRANAALITDLKQRGLLDETLVIWGGEFGRTVFCQGKLEKNNFGREHHGMCFTMWLAGGGIKPGLVYGKTDEWSFRVTENPVPVADLYATAMHQLGIHHESLTYRFQGRDFRLTDLAGNVRKEILA